MKNKDRLDMKPKPVEELPHKPITEKAKEHKPKPVKEGEYKREGAGLRDYFSKIWQSVKSFFVGVKQTISDLKSISLSANTILYAVIGIAILWLILRFVI